MKTVHQVNQSSVATLINWTILHYLDEDSSSDGANNRWCSASNQESSYSQVVSTTSTELGNIMYL